MSGKKVVVVMPAYNAARTLARTVELLPRDSYDEIILVDDASQDATLEIARELGDRYPISVHALERNRGYGGNQKECYRLALAHDADVIVLLHPDLQYDPSLVPTLAAPVIAGEFPLMIGSRIRSLKDARAGGMPFYKYVSNRMLTKLENAVSGRNLSEWHTGMRAFAREALEQVEYGKFSNGFLFDTQMLFGIVAQGYAIGEMPVPVRYAADSSSVSFMDSVLYGLGTVVESAKHGISRLL